MGKNQIYNIDFKLQVVGKYEQGKCGYKRLAREFNLSRDTVRSWCLNPKLHSATEMAKKNKINDDKDLEYYRTAAIFWEQYARNIEAELAKQGKKKLLLKTMKDCLEQNPELKTRKLCEDAGIPTKNIICMQGPFIKEMNIATLEQYKCNIMVTKNTGKPGGLEDKIACASDKIKVVVINKPKEEDGLDFNEIKDVLEGYYGRL